MKWRKLEKLRASMIPKNDSRYIFRCEEVVVFAALPVLGV